jgi:hypothetical protein
LFAGFIAPLLFLPSGNWTLFANSASISCAFALVVESMLWNKFYRKYQTNLALAQKGWFAELSREFRILSFLGLCLGVYGALLWGFGQTTMERLLG